MIRPSVTTVGIERVQATLAMTIPGLYRELARTIESLAITLQGLIREDYLNQTLPGPGGLHRVTGNLSRSINYRIDKSDKAITARVGTNVLYGRFWEMGFSGTQQVHPFIRHIKNVMGRIDVGHGEMKRRKIASGIAYVRSFDRKVNQPPRAFLRPALDELRPQIRDEIRLAMVRAVGRASRGG